MTNPTKPTIAPKPARKTKAALVARLISREKGATIDEIAGATSWQVHSCRAFLTGLRKKGIELAKEERGDGKTAYRTLPLSAEIAAALGTSV